jgi:hypothetical protein
MGIRFQRLLRDFHTRVGNLPCFAAWIGQLSPQCTARTAAPVLGLRLQLAESPALAWWERVFVGETCVQKAPSVRT